MNSLYTHSKRKEIRILLFILLLICFPLLDIHGQQAHEISLDVPRIVPIFPEASSMERNQSYPVDYCTGVPSITIPLYEIVAGEVTIPITLSYHASGLKPKERSGFAGTGWTLNLEPSIMREIKGTADDDEYGWFKNRHQSPPNDERERLQYYADRVDNKHDTQPDKFVYKLPHSAGSGYFLEPTVSLTTIPRTNDRVYFNYGSMNATDANGIQYLFDGVHEKAGKFITRWLCTSIRSPRQTNPLVTFEYTITRSRMHPGDYFNLDGRVIINDIESSSPYVIMTRQQNSHCDHFRVEPDVFNSDTWSTKLTSVSEGVAGVHYPPASSYVNEIASEARLEKVHFFNNTLSVTYRETGTNVTHSDVYKKMEVTDLKGNIIRTIEFFINPYNNKTSLTKLDSVRIAAPDVETKVYAFHYKDTYQVPSIYTTAVDHWGFCNGSDHWVGNEVTVPSFRQILYMPLGNLNKGKALIEYEGVNREPNAEWTQAGILTRIIDPQGVQTNFVYEGNCGAFRDNNRPKGNDDYLHPVGGVRVKSIETYDPHANERTIKTYRYGLTKLFDPDYEPIWGGGAIKHIVSQRDYCSSMSAYNVNAYGTSSWFEYMTTYVSMPQSNITFSNGSAVMYNIVSEEVCGKEMDCIKTDYYYYVNAHPFEGVLWWNSYDNIVKNFLYTQPEEKIWKIFRHSPYHPQEPSDDLLRHFTNSGQYNGLLARKNCFKGSELASRTDYSYKRIGTSSDVLVYLPVRKLQVDINEYMKHPSDLSSKEVYAPSNYYEPTSGNSQLQTTFFLDNNLFYVLDQETNTEYMKIGNRKDSLVTTRRYTYDTYSYGYSYTMEPKKIEILNSDGNSVSDEYDYLYEFPAVMSCHKRCEGGSSEERRILFKEGTCFPQRIQSKTDRLSDYCDEVVYTAYDGHNNVAEIRGKDGTPITFLWGYQNRFPIAKIENATREQVLLKMGFPATATNVLDSWSGGVEPTDEMKNKISSLRVSLPNARVTTYEYEPMKGVTAITDQNNVVTRFEYDGYSRLTDSYYMDPDLKKVMLQRNIYHLGK